MAFELSLEEVEICELNKLDGWGVWAKGRVLQRPEKAWYVWKILSHLGWLGYTGLGIGKRAEPESCGR